MVQVLEYPGLRSVGAGKVSGQTGSGTSRADLGCDGCRNRGPACGNCVFSSVIVADGEQLPSFEDDELMAIAALAGQGLVPPLRLAPVRAA